MTTAPHDEHDEHDGGPPLDDGARALLRAYGREQRIPDEVHERVWTRLHDDAAPIARRHRWGGAFALGVLAAAALALLWVGSKVLVPTQAQRSPDNAAGYDKRGIASGGVATPSTPAAPTRAHGERAPEQPTATAQPPDQTFPPPPTRETSSAAQPASPPPAAEASTTKPSRPATRRREATRKVAPAERDPIDTLAEENRIIATARAALLRRDFGQALAELAKHRRRFANGVLTEERHALRAIALCESGNNTEGTAAASTFVRTHPNAALAPRVRAACLD